MEVTGLFGEQFALCHQKCSTSSQWNWEICHSKSVKAPAILLEAFPHTERGEGLPLAV